MRRAPRAATLVAAVCFVLMSTVVASADVPSTNPTTTDMVNGPVRAIVQTGNDIWIGGSFTEVLDANLNPIAAAGGLVAFNDSGQLDTSMQRPLFTSTTETPYVYGLSVGPNGELYVAGDFDAVNGMNRKNAAEIDPSTGVLQSWSPHSVPAFSVLATSSAIYVGGSRLQSFSPSGGQTPGWTDPQLATDPSLRGHVTNPNVRRIAESGSTLVIACQCDSITDANGTHPTKAVAEIDADTGDLVNWAPSNLAASSSAFGIDEIIQDFPGTSDPTVFLAAGGNDFTAAYSIASGHMYWSTDTSGSSQAITSFQGQLVVGGHFDWTHAPGSSDCGDHEHPNTNCYLTPHLVAMNTTTGAIILQGGVPWNPGICCLYDGVWSVLADTNGTTLHVGGAFTLAGAGTWSYDPSTGLYSFSGRNKQDYYARFDAPLASPQTLTASVTGTGTGSVSSSPTGISCPTTCSASFPGNSTVALTAKAGAGSAFTGWSGDCSGAGTCSVVMSEARSVVATFTSAPPRTLTVARAGNGTGTVTSSPTGISCGSTCSASFANGTPVSLTAVAGPGSTFTGWSGDCSGAGSCAVTMSVAHAVTATFVPTPRQLAVTPAGDGTGTVTSSPTGISCGSTCSASFANGTPVTLTAAADPGSTFTGWSGDCTGTGTCAVTMNAARAVTATFEKVVCGKILFTSARAGNGDIFVMNADGSGVVNLTHNAARDASPTWSADCKEIAFASTRGGTTWHIFEMNANGGAVTRITNGPGNDTQPTWAPGGKRLAFVSDRAGNKELYTIGTAGTGLVRLTHNTWADVQPDWSPVNNLIVFASNRFGPMDLFTIQPDGSHRTRLTDGARSTSQPAWSPSGARIAFISYASGAAQVWTMTAAGTGDLQITRDGSTDGHPSWSPVGNQIAYSSSRSGNREIWVISSHGVGAVNVTNNAATDTAPSWR